MNGRNLRLLEQTKGFKTHYFIKQDRPTNENRHGQGQKNSQLTTENCHNVNAEEEGIDQLEDDYRLLLQGQMNGRELRTYRTRIMCAS